MRKAFLGLIAIMTLVWSVIPNAQGTTFINWSQYLFALQHSSDNAATTAITTANASKLVKAWRWVPPAATVAGSHSNLFASPTVYNGVIYIGTGSGVFYAINGSTGQVIWSQFASDPQLTPTTKCGTWGFTSTATVDLGPDLIGPDPTADVPIVYVAAGSGLLFALRASDGAVEWSSVIDTPDPTHDLYPWASPTLSGGHIYQGWAVVCTGAGAAQGLKEYDQATGNLVATWYGADPGGTGGGMWSTAAASDDGAYVFGTTANAAHAHNNGSSIVKLSATDLTLVDHFRVPKADAILDGDFGGSPTLFQVVLPGDTTPTQLVGACNKNGIYYVLRQSSFATGLVWKFRAGVADTPTVGQCDAAAVWDGSRMFIASNGTTINGTDYLGSVRRMDPATGTPIWQTGLAGPIIGTPTMNGSGVIAATSWGATLAQDRLWLINASNGQILATIDKGSKTFAQPVFADGFLFFATNKKGLFAFRPGALPPSPAVLRPSAVPQGETNVAAVLTGSGFAAGAIVTSATGISASASYVSASELDLSLTIDPTVSPGVYDLSVDNPDGGIGTCAGCLTVTSDPVPSITGVAPTNVGQNSEETLTLTGTDFTSGAQIAVSASGLTISQINDLDPTTLTLTLSVDASASSGPSDISVSTPGGTSTCAGCLLVESSASSS
jgi:outer membrane protein assembly factor BamB